VFLFFFFHSGWCCTGKGNSERVMEAPSLETFKARLDQSEQPDLAVDVSVRCNGIGLDDL